MLTSAESTGLPRVKPDQWGPLVSDTVLTSVVDRWGQVNGHVSRVNADVWVPLVRFDLARPVDPLTSA